jgi:hypothetical protein
MIAEADGGGCTVLAMVAGLARRPRLPGLARRAWRLRGFLRATIARFALGGLAITPPLACPLLGRFAGAWRTLCPVGPLGAG